MLRDQWQQIASCRPAAGESEAWPRDRTCAAASVQSVSTLRESQPDRRPSGCRQFPRCHQQSKVAESPAVVCAKLQAARRDKQTLARIRGSTRDTLETNAAEPLLLLKARRAAQHRANRDQTRRHSTREW